MPFSKERTELIQTRLRDRLENGATNEWERSFFENMVERFDHDGQQTRLSKAQYRKLHQLLGLTNEAGKRPLEWPFNRKR